MDKFDLLCNLQAISNFAYDIHYTAKGRNFYSDHIFSERLADIDVMDDFIETFYLGESEDAPDSSKISAKVAEITPKPVNDTQMNFKTLREMIVKVLIAIQNYKGTKGEEDLLGSVAHILQRHNGLLFRELVYTPEEIRNSDEEWENLVTAKETMGGELNNEKWITVHPNKENPDDYRRLKVEDGETSKEAVERKYGKDKKDKEPEKEEKKETEAEGGDKLYQDFVKSKDVMAHLVKSVEAQKAENSDAKIGDTIIEIDSLMSKYTDKLSTDDYNKWDSEKAEKAVFDKLKEIEKEYGFKEGKEENRDKDGDYKTEIETFKKIKKKLIDDYDKEFNSFYEYNKKIREEARKLTEEEVGKKNATNFSKWNISFSNNVEKLKEREGYEDRKKESEQKKEKLYDDIKNLQKEVAKKTYYPQTLAGKERGKSMTHQEADKGKSNPFFKKATKEYTENCQTCVVAYEARRRGYDVRAGGIVRGNKSDVLSSSAKDAWIDGQTGDIASPDEEFWDMKNYKEIKDMLDKKVEKDKRYNISFLWKNRSSNYGHVISVEKDEEGLFLYDPQRDETRRGKDISDYLRRVKTGSSFEFYRVDDKSFNPEFMDDILKGE